jgi:hypothetical protein
MTPLQLQLQLPNPSRLRLRLQLPQTTPLLLPPGAPHPTSPPLLRQSPQMPHPPPQLPHLPLRFFRVRLFRPVLLVLRVLPPPRPVRHRFRCRELSRRFRTSS